MTRIPIIDSHVHLWDTRALRYPWLDNVPGLNRPFLFEDYRAASEFLPIEGIVFVQCEAEPGAAFKEAAWASQLAETEPCLKAIVAQAPLEKGSAVLADLLRLSRLPIVRGIRRVIQSEPDLDFCLRPAFIEGVRALKDLNLTFDLCVDHRHLENIVGLADRVPEVSMALDHIGKPGIKAGSMRPWADHIRELARFPHVWCKISAVATEADHSHWTADQLNRYSEVAIEAFGFDRVMFGGDWPVSTQAIGYGQWIEVLDQLLSGVSERDQEHFWRSNAAQFYRI
jgi:L-fuconolactonase